MRKFGIPQMEMIRIESKSIIFTSLCNSNYCDGHKCDACADDDQTCLSVTACTVHNCGHVLCPSYTG